MSDAVLGRIQVEGLRDAEGRFARWEQAIEPIQRDRIRTIVRRLTDLIRQEGPRGDHKGPHAVDGIIFQTRVTGRGVIEANIYATGPKAHIIPMIRFGTKPHEIPAIQARAKKALKFFWRRGPNGPGVYFFKRVRAHQHPGTQPNDFVMRVWTREQSVTFADLRSIAREVIQGVGG